VLKNRLNLLFLLSTFFMSIACCMDNVTEQQIFHQNSAGNSRSIHEDRKIELVSKEGKKFEMKRKIAEHQSGLLQQMLEEQPLRQAPVSAEASTGRQDDLPSVALAKEERGHEVPSIPVPNISSKRLEDMRELMEEAYEYKSESQEQQKKKLAKFIEEGISKNRSELCVRQNILIDTLAGANYLNAPLILKSLAYVLSQWKVTKDMLRKYSRDLFWHILAEYMVRFKKNPLKIFDDKTIKDLKKEKLYDEAAKTIAEENKMFVPEYSGEKGLFKKEKVALGETVEIGMYIEGFEDTFNWIVFVSDRGKLVFCDVNNPTKCKVRNLWVGKKDSKSSFAVLSPCGRHVFSASFAEYNYPLISNYSEGLKDNLVQESLEVWDVDACKRLKRGFSEVKGVFLEQLGFSKKYVGLVYRKSFTAEQKELVKIWDLETQKCVEQVGVESANVSLLICSANGKYLAVATLGSFKERVFIWDLKGSVYKRRFYGNPKLMSFSPCEKYIVLFGKGRMRESTLKMYKVETGKRYLKCVFDGVYYGSLIFSPSGKNIVLVGNKITVVNLQDKSCVNLKADKMLPGVCFSFSYGMQLQKGAVLPSVVFSLCEKYVVTVEACEKEKTTSINCKMWNIKSGECEKELEPFEIPDCGMPLKGSIALRKLI